jgi:predicted small integral membrane protein
MLRTIKILLVLSVSAWALIGAFGNVIDWDGTTGAVAAATSMSTFEGGADDWRATTNPGVILAGALFILVLKLAAGLLCAVGAFSMWTALGRDSGAFQKAKGLALAGCGVAIFMLFTGWIVIAETWFEMWRSDVMRDVALGSAFRYCGMIGVIALFIGATDDA